MIGRDGLVVSVREAFQTKTETSVLDQILQGLSGAIIWIIFFSPDEILRSLLEASHVLRRCIRLLILLYHRRGQIEIEYLRRSL